MATYGTPQAVTNGLVFYLDAANLRSYSSGSVNWYDLSGSTISGSFVTASYSNINGGAITFNGVTSSVLVNSNILSDSGGSVNMWCNAQAPAQSGQSAYMLSAFGSNNDRFYIAMNTTYGLSVYRGNPQTGFTLATVSQNQWYNITMTWTAGPTGSLSGYLNGILKGTVTYTASGSTTNFTIGGYWTPVGSQAFSGSIASTQIYNRPLSQQEVVQNYNALKSRFNIT